MTRRAVAPLVVATVKLVVSLLVLWSGFRSISDDDYARVAIAQQFVTFPKLDPSGTSWLPLPFWVYGGAMTLFGTSLETARVTALVVGVVAAIGVWASARWLGAGPRAALLGAILAAFFPHAAYYGAAMVPDYPTAVLTLLGAASLGQARPVVRLLGAVSIGMATLCRYEAWPVAIVVTAYAVYDARRKGERAYLVTTALVAPIGAIAWLLHGIVAHHDAWFFVKRVAAYRQALGGSALALSERLLQQPRALVTAEPELVALAAAFGIATLVCPRALATALPPGWGGPAQAGAAPGLEEAARQGGAHAAPTRAQLPRFVAALGSLLVFLVVGTLLDGAPTHHEERTLLPIWLGLALYVGRQLEALMERAGSASPPGAARARIVLAGCILLCLGVATLVRPAVTRREPFVDRSREIRIGKVAARRVPPGERLALYTDDYGYFAIEVAFSRPLDVQPLLRHDPRALEVDPFADPTRLAQRLDALRTRYIVMPMRPSVAVGLGAVLHSEPGGFMLARRE